MREQRGYVFRKGKSWFLRYVDDLLQSDGTPRRKQVCVKLAPFNDEYRSKASVRQFATKLLAPLNARDLDSQSTMAIETFITSVYLPEVRENLRRSTYKNYRDIFNIHVRPRLAGKTLRKFRCCDAKELLDDVWRQARTKQGQPLSHSSLERIKAFLSGAFKCAKRLGAFDGENPIRDSRVPKGMPARQTHAYSPEEIRKILGVLKEPARTVCLLMAHTGLRKGECMGLLWRDYDRRVLNVERSLWEGFCQEPKTSAGKAPIPVTPQLRDALEAHKERMERQGQFTGPGFPIFQSEVGTPMNLANLVKRVIVPALKAADREPSAGPIPSWDGWHAFRRGLATNLHASGVQDKTISSILRHSNVSITQDLYIKTVEETAVNAMNLIGAEMEGRPGRSGTHRKLPRRRTNPLRTCPSPHLRLRSRKLALKSEEKTKPASK